MKSGNPSGNPFLSRRGMYIRVQSDRVDRLIQWITEWIKITISSKMKSGNPSGNPFLSRKGMYLRVKVIVIIHLYYLTPYTLS